MNRIGDRLELERDPAGDRDDWVLRLLNVAVPIRTVGGSHSVAHVRNPNGDGSPLDAAELHLTTYDLWRIVELVEQVMYGDEDVPGRLTMPAGPSLALPPPADR